jgi:xanthine dehydrogenase accessory factor
MIIRFPLIALRGGGDLATGIGHRLFNSGFPLLVLELAEPRVIRRKASFAQALFCGQWTVEGVKAVACATPQVTREFVPVVVDPHGDAVKALKPPILIDARMLKKNADTSASDAPVVIAVGPGYKAGTDAHAVVETMRGHNLGRVYLHGEAHRDTGVPSEIGGHSGRRVVRAPREGIFEEAVDIGALVREGQFLGRVDGVDVLSPLSGTVRGLIMPGLRVFAGEKIADIDPRQGAECDTISDKARAVAGGVLEAVMLFRDKWLPLAREK